MVGSPKSTMNDPSFHLYGNNGSLAALSNTSDHALPRRSSASTSHSESGSEDERDVSKKRKRAMNVT